MFGLVTYSIALPFGTLTRLGAISRPGRVIDLRNAYHAHLALTEQDPQAADIAAVRIPVTMRALIEGDRFSLAAVHAAVAFADATGESIEIGRHTLQLSFPAEKIILLPPLQPGKMVCAGRNYLAHAAQSTMPIVDDFPRGFIKVNSSLLGPYQDLPYPAATEQLEYEVELAVIIGKAGRDIAESEAYDHIFGYTAFNDMSARDWQFAERTKGNHLLGKNLDATGPLGPMIVPREFIADPMDLGLSLRINGTLKQQSRTANMMFDIKRQIAHWSKMTLHPGDLIATGTPETIGSRDLFLKPGDVVEAEVEQIGILRNRIVPSC